jgi:hypothetical protein
VHLKPAKHAAALQHSSKISTPRYYKIKYGDSFNIWKTELAVKT